MWTECRQRVIERDRGPYGDFIGSACVPGKGPRQHASGVRHDEAQAIVIAQLFWLGWNGVPAQIGRRGHDPIAGLVQDARDRAVYLVAVRGDAYVTRRIARASLKQAARNGAALNFRFSDFTFPKAAMTFADEVIARDWETRIAAA